MSWRYCFVAAATLMAVPCWVSASDFRQPPTEPQSNEQAEDALVDPGEQSESAGELSFLTRGQSPGYVRESAARFGWWGISTDGALNKTGEWQDLDSSAFWDFDGLWSDGTSTLDFTATGTDNETTDVDGHYFSPGYSGLGLSVDVEYDRFLHRLDHDPLTNFTNVPFPAAPLFDAVDGNLVNPGTLNRAFMRQDFNAGEDYAVRVQELDVAFKGRVNENVKWRLNLWGMRKSGERQARNVSHCFNSPWVDDDEQGGLIVDGNTVATEPPGAAAFFAEGGRACHALSQRQRIDWLTMEIEPVLEARFGAVTVEYSRTMRSFNQDDQFVHRNHTTNDVGQSIGGVGDGVLPVGGTGLGSVVGYAVVPENFTEIDRLKIGADISEYNDFYALLYRGNTHNKNRETDREFGGFDLRLTNQAVEGLSVTGYAKKYEENNENAPFLAPDGTELIPSGPDAGTTRLEHPWDREKTSVGLKGRWRRFYGSPHALIGGYDYTLMDREFTEHTTERTGPDQEEFVWTQPTTIYHTAQIGVNSRWSPCFDTYLRYKRQWIRDPLFASHEPNGVTNSSLPTDVDLVEFGGTWTPTYNFLLAATVGLENSSHSSDIASFTEDDYPMTFSAWYAPTSKWSFSAGYAVLTNWIDQDITLGDQVDRWSASGASFRHQLAAETTRWSYGGRAQMVNVGGRYAWTDCFSLLGSLEWTRGRNRFSSPSPDPYDLSPTGTPGFPVTPDWSDLPSLSDVIVETTRFTAGFDYDFSERVACFFRYNYFDYEDKSVDFNSGTAHMFLGGVAATF